MIYLAFAIVGYCVGSFPTGVVLSRRKYGIDVREMGSGNIGATNVTRVFGWYAGVLVFLIDFLKSFVPLVLIRAYFPRDPWLLTVAGTSLVLGHCFSLYLKLAGGKGVATSLGCLVVVAPWLAVVSILFYVTLLVTTRISAIGSLGGIAISWAYLLSIRPQPPVSALILAITFIVVLRHGSNIRRLVETARKRAAQKESKGAS